MDVGHVVLGIFTLAGIGYAIKMHTENTMLRAQMADLNFILTEWKESAWAWESYALQQVENLRSLQFAPVKSAKPVSIDGNGTKSGMLFDTSDYVSKDHKRGHYVQNDEGIAVWAALPDSKVTPEPKAEEKKSEKKSKAEPKAEESSFESVRVAQVMPLVEAEIKRKVTASELEKIVEKIPFWIEKTPDIDNAEMVKRFKGMFSK